MNNTFVGLMYLLVLLFGIWLAAFNLKHPNLLFNPLSNLISEIETRIKNRDWNGKKLKKAHADLAELKIKYGPITIKDMERIGPMFQGERKKK